MKPMESTSVDQAGLLTSTVTKVLRKAERVVKKLKSMELGLVVDE